MIPESKTPRPQSFASAHEVNLQSVAWPDSVRTKPASGTCALCREERPLRKSHVIPEFMFGPLYDEKHRFHGVSNISTKPNQIFQKGPREKLLCDNCERQVSRYESYASDVFFGNAATQPVPTPTGLLFTGLDYKPLKLFFISVLWRLGTTSITHLKGAELGPHQERVRSLLCADDPADYLTFPAMVTALMFDRQHIADLIVPPLHSRVEGRRVWAVVVSGFLFHFFVSNRQPPQNVWGGFLQENGNFPLHLTDIRQVAYLQKWGREIAAAETARQRSSKKRRALD
jgi:hypothetical protein